jgi:hypothetical protein
VTLSFTAILVVKKNKHKSIRVALTPLAGYVRIIYVSINSYADVAELADALDLGSSAERHGGSSPFIRTKQNQKALRPFFVLA